MKKFLLSGIIENNNNLYGFTLNTNMAGIKESEKRIDYLKKALDKLLLCI